ncbi:MAG: hypothetical protein ACR2OM_04235, partial [Aestuariivirgaceae bacterium]
GHIRARQEINNWGEPGFRLRLPAIGRTMGQPRAWIPGSAPVHGSQTDLEGLRLQSAASPQASFFDLLEVIENGKVRVRIRRTERDGYAHNGFTLGADARGVITGGGSGWLRQYDPAGRLLGDYSGHTSDVWAVSASLHGKYLASGSDDQTLRLWNRISRENIVSLFHASDGQWVMWTPQGYFSASPDGDEFIGWHVNQGAGKAARFVTAAQLKQHFYRPDIVDEAIRLASARQAVARAQNTEFSFGALAERAPPAFKVVAVNPRTEAATIKLQLTLKVAAGNDAPSRLGVIVNGRNSYNGDAGLPGTAGGQMSIDIAGAPGRNLIEINLHNEVGVTTRRIAVSAPQIDEVRRERLFILSIGVN